MSDAFANPLLGFGGDCFADEKAVNSLVGNATVLRDLCAKGLDGSAVGLHVRQPRARQTTFCFFSVFRLYFVLMPS